jgi:hypothetical protein
VGAKDLLVAQHHAATAIVTKDYAATTNVGEHDSFANVGQHDSFANVGEHDSFEFG